MLKRTPFYDFHVSSGARMVEFAGWEMPLLYRGIVEEHLHTRASGSIFDVSHMGRIYLSGKETAAFLNRALTRNVLDMGVGQCRYSLACNPAGGVLDDVIVARDQKQWVIVCNASNREKLLRHLIDLRRQTGMDLDIADQTEGTAMVAIQGPKVIERLASVLPVDLAAMKRYHFETGSVMLVRMTVFRTGYTGEDGVEIILPAKIAGMAIRMLAGSLTKEGATLQPAGLGARDTLRLEAGMPLYGHELGEQTDPMSAGLGWAVDLAKDFVGAEALRAMQPSGPRRRLVGLELEGRRIARQGTPIKAGEQLVGEATSGTFGPTLQKSIAMAYVDSASAAEGTQLTADIQGAATPARVVPLPFYRRK